MILNKSSWIHLSLGLCLFLGIAIVAISWRGNAEQDLQSAHTPKINAAVREIEQTKTADASRAVYVADGTPLRDIVASLEKEAASGSSSAACRLSIEYERCNLAARQLDQLALLDDSQNQSPHAAFVGRTDKFEDTLLHCEGVDAQSSLKTAALLRQSALQGNLAAMTTYASGNGFSMFSLVEAADEFVQFKELAPSIINQAVERGSATALLILAASHSPFDDGGAPSFLSQAVGKNPAKALALFKVAQRAKLGSEGSAYKAHIDNQIERLESLLSPAELSDADRMTNRYIGIQFDQPSPQDLSHIRLGKAPPLSAETCDPN